MQEGVQQHENLLQFQELQIAASNDIAALREWLCGPNGFLREAALRRVAALPAKSLWIDVIERVNDWVPEIRDLAGEIIQFWLQDEQVDTVITLLPAFGRLRIKQRSDHSALLAAVEVWMTRPEHAEVLAQTVQHHTNPHVVRYAYELLERTVGDDRRALANFALNSVDVVTQKKAISLIQSFEVPVQRFYAEKFLSSRSVLLRWHGLKILNSIDSESAVERSRLYLLSSHASLREAAIALCGLSQVELQEFIVGRIRSSDIKFSELSVGLHLLSSSGNKAYTELISQYLGHARAQVAGAALVAVARLEPQRICAQLPGLLMHSDFVVAQAALRACRAADFRPSPVEWAAITAAARTLAEAQRVLALANHVDKWTHLCMLLELAKIGGSVADLCCSHFRDWRVHFNRSSAQINDWQLESIRSNLGMAERVGSSCDELNFYLN